jgi:hypothetical protein
MRALATGVNEGEGVCELYARAVVPATFFACRACQLMIDSLSGLGRIRIMRLSFHFLYERGPAKRRLEWLISDSQCGVSVGFPPELSFENKCQSGAPSPGDAPRGSSEMILKRSELVPMPPTTCHGTGTPEKAYNTAPQHRAHGPHSAARPIPKLDGRDNI